jgi:diacylglycerol kinase
MNTYTQLSITLAITVGLLYEAEPNQSFTTA